MNWNQALFPSLKRRGGCAIKKMSRSNLSSRRRGGQIGEIFRPEEFRRTDHPVCGASEASRLFSNAAATPPFQGGECVRTETVCQFIHTFFSRRVPRAAFRRCHPIGIRGSFDGEFSDAVAAGARLLSVRHSCSPASSE